MKTRERFPMTAATAAEARRYLNNRAIQALMDGWKSDPKPESVEWGLLGRACSPEGIWHQTFYVLEPFRHRGLVAPVLRERGLPVVTTLDCGLEPFLVAKQLPHTVICAFTQCPEYRAISAFYANRSAARSAVPYMNHIDEGLAVLRVLGATEAARRAFCIHPLVQSDEDLLTQLPTLDRLGIPASSWALAFEYRAVANATLSARDLHAAADIPLGPLVEVHQMLRADKLQNQKDFLAHHAKSHPRRDVLARYFELWLQRLGVTPALAQQCNQAMRAGQ